MKTTTKWALLMTIMLCSYNALWAQIVQHAQKLPPADFSEQLAQSDSALVLDVRTPAEFAEGHLNGALNINWNGESFEEQVSLIDRSTPIYLYCRSGGRSGSAAEKLEALGFAHIVDLTGGMIAWRAAELPERSAEAYVADGMDLEYFYDLLRANERVFVNFYADWCMPCLAMKPYLERIIQEADDDLDIVHINIDENRKVSETLDTSTLPVLRLYERAEQIWEHRGYLDEIALRERFF